MNELIGRLRFLGDRRREELILAGNKPSEITDDWIIEYQAADELKAKDQEIEKLQARLKATEEQAITEGRIVAKCNKRIEELESQLCTASNTIGMQSHRVAELMALSKYHALEMGCECRDCYQLREAEQYNHLSTAGERE